MDTESELGATFREWRRLAEAKGQAIRARNWAFVRDCQNALQCLRSRIDSVAEDARRHWILLGPDGASRRQALRAAVRELIDIERRNQQSLERHRDRLAAEGERLKQAGQNLRQLRKTYARALPSNWCSYS
jgi:ElaB/YqjD/DUF883 family membrane-anchored ribosome-binding protein